MRRLALLPLLALAVTACDSSPGPDETDGFVYGRSVVHMNYEGRLESGDVFDEGDSLFFDLSRVIPGFRDGMIGMAAGESRTFDVSPEDGYGESGVRGPDGTFVIPPDATLTFEVDVIEVFPDDTVADNSQTVVVDYEGRLADGTVFDEGTSAALTLNRVIPGFRNGVVGMTVGETRTFDVPPEEAYGEDGVVRGGDVVIPPNATLTFEVTLRDVN
jgi:FKBP-type peptidyl-prolyl cis-trans isomerase